MMLVCLCVCVFACAPDRLKSVLTVAGTLVSSNCEVLYGPFGSWITVPFGIQGEISIAEVRRPASS
jgi:hypothetical protein